jgi:hypothetical protein
VIQCPGDRRRPSAGQQGQDPRPGVVLGRLLEGWGIRPEERVPGAGVDDQFVVDTRAPQRVADLAALAGVDQADQPDQTLVSYAPAQPG